MRFIYSKTFIRLFAGFVLVALYIIADAFGYVGVVKGAFLSAYGASAGLVAKVTDEGKDILGAIATIKRLSHENAVLSQKVDELSFQNARMQSAKQENAALRRAMEFKDDSQLNLLPAQVKSLDSTGFSKIVMIDKGERDGVNRGQAVIIAPGILVGRITKIYPNDSEVTLITDPSVSVSAEVADSQARGLVKGEHGLGLVFDLVTQNEVIKNGDKILTSGLSNDYPKGLLIGEITGIRSSSSELFQKAYITPAAELKSLKFVFVTI
ncbi:MAG: rod shape-determining protein MreC [Candidatus Saccharibacteria bacterium]